MLSHASISVQPASYAVVLSLIRDELTLSELNPRAFGRAELEHVKIATSPA